VSGRSSELLYLLGPLPDLEDLLPTRQRRLDWAALLARVFAADVLACPRCSGRMNVLAAISAPAVASKILSHLGLPTTLPSPAPARAPPWTESELDLDATIEAKMALDIDVDPAADFNASLDC